MVWQNNLSLLDKQQPAKLVVPAQKSGSSSSSNKGANGLAGGKLPAKGGSKGSIKGAAAAGAGDKAAEKPKRTQDIMLQGIMLELWRQLCMGERNRMQQYIY